LRRRGPGASTGDLLKRNQGDYEQKFRTTQSNKSKERDGSSSGNKKGDKENQSNYTICSSHDSIVGKYFLALQMSCLKVLLKISKQRKLLTRIPLKIVSFLTVQMSQYIIIITSIKNFL
jgi:hypothetical protein